jgi:cephalosporin hydroxylase
MGTDIETTLKQFSKLGIFSHNPLNGIGLWKEEQELLLKLVGDSKKYFEIGSHNLGSALLIEEHAKTLGIEREVFALDIKFSPWAQLNYDRAKSNITRLECDSKDLRDHNKQLAGTDFIFIDGFHSFKQVMHDFEYSQGLMTNGGIIAFHDTSPKLDDQDYVSKCQKFAEDNFDELTSSNHEDFYVDEAIVYMMNQYNVIGKKAKIPFRFELINCTIECYHPRETRLSSWIRGKTSPHSAIWALRVIRPDKRGNDED